MVQPRIDSHMAAAKAPAGGSADKASGPSAKRGAKAARAATAFVDPVAPGRRSGRRVSQVPAARLRPPFTAAAGPPCVCTVCPY